MLHLDLMVSTTYLWLEYHVLSKQTKRIGVTLDLHSCTEEPDIHCLTPDVSVLRTS